MNILFILTYYRPHWTGLTQYAARLAEGLASHGHRVSVLCSKHDHTHKAKEIINEVRIVRSHALFRISRSQFSPFLILHYLQMLIKQDAIVIYLPFQEVLPIAVLAKLFRKRLYLVHNGDLQLPKGFINRIIETVYMVTTSLAIKFSSAVIIQTIDYANYSKLLLSCATKRRVLLPLYESVHVSKSDRMAFVKKHQLTGKKLVGFSGRFVEEKGIDNLLKAIPFVLKKLPHAHFIFAGEYYISYEHFWDRIRPLFNAYNKYCTLLGLLVDKKELVCFYQSLGLLVQPSRSDCFPSSLVEALLAGIPAVVADVPGARWIVQKTGMGVVVDARNPQALANGIVNVLNHREQYVVKHQQAIDLFDYAHTLQAYERLFKS